MTLTKKILPALAALMLAACDTDVPVMTDADMPLIIEGWIEDGGFPIVMVTRAANLQDEISSFDKYVEKWCRVTVSDDRQSVVLTGRLNHDYTPPFIYTTTRMRGRVGTTYHLKVETEDQTVEADATIRPYVRIDSLCVRPCDISDGLMRVMAYADVEPDGCYKFFTRVSPGEQRFYSSFLGTFAGSNYDAEKGFDVMRGIHATYTGTFTPYYDIGDTVRVKLCTLEPEIYAFWRAYENSVSLSTNMFFSSAGGCPSNIPGAKGYWAAYGYSAATIIIK